MPEGDGDREVRGRLGEREGERERGERGRRVIENSGPYLSV